VWVGRWQPHREGELKGGLVTQGPATSGGPAVAQKYKVPECGNLKRKIQIFFPDGPRENVSPGPAVALRSRQAWSSFVVGSSIFIRLMSYRYSSSLR